MLSSEMHSPEKLASRPPAIKISGNIPVDSDAHGIVPRALSPAERPGCCSDFIYSESWSSRHCHSALVLGRAALGGTRAPPTPPHVCTHGVQPSSAPVLMPSPETQAKGPLRLACAAADGDGAVPCPPSSNVPTPERAPGQQLSVLRGCELSPKGSQEEAEKKQTDAGHVCPGDV